MIESKIADEVMNPKNEDESEDREDEDKTTLPTMKFSEVRSHLDDQTIFIDFSSDIKVQLYSTHLRNFRELITKKKQQTSKVQTKLYSFFKTGLLIASTLV
ncbi:unnamed protein product [Diabrotica balteata]|uniref:Uncharacterized protein n=1 Tax=Diabrotica balteata TaxID=107213 RepID=A0A9N9XE28_DIABA|nr:unnamed protein product [Diabrotica balteata]